MHLSERNLPLDSAPDKSCLPRRSLGEGGSLPLDDARDGVVSLSNPSKRLALLTGQRHNTLNGQVAEPGLMRLTRNWKIGKNHQQPQTTARAFLALKKCPADDHVGSPGIAKNRPETPLRLEKRLEGFLANASDVLSGAFTFIFSFEKSFLEEKRLLQKAFFNASDKGSTCGRSCGVDFRRRFSETAEISSNLSSNFLTGCFKGVGCSPHPLPGGGLS